MDNLAVNLEQQAAELGQPITHAVLGVHYKFQCGKSKDPAPVGRVLSWENARPFLDEEYDAGYGGADCRPFYAWSRDWVFWVHEYDGSTSIAKAPREPRAIMPEFSGA